MRQRYRSALIGCLALVLVLAACGSGDDGGSAPTDVDVADWQAVLDEADGQTVNWYMFGGDDVLNAFVDEVVGPRLEDLGVELNQVRINDTAEAITKILGDVQAGRTDDGSVDAVWVNGENFATGVQADLWACGWSEDLPNARFVDFDDPSTQVDFGTPVDGCEAVWQRANSALVYDSAVLDAADVDSIETFVAWVEDNPGRFAYPAPPDFTGSMAVRTLLYGLAATPDELPGDFDEAAYEEATDGFFDRLEALEPSLWRGGSTYPTTQADVEELYVDGQIDAFFTYGPGATRQQVAQGRFPDTTRQAVPAPGNIANISFVAVPANAAHRAAGFVLADLLLDPAVQLELYERTGIAPAIDVDALDPDVAASFDAVPRGASVLSPTELTESALPELASRYLTRIEDDWIERVLQR